MNPLPMPTAAQVGVELARYVNENHSTPGDPDRYRGLVDLMLDAPSSTPVDALALVAWVTHLLPVVYAALPEDECPIGGPRAVLSTANSMAQRALKALEHSVGLPPEAFTGHAGPAN